MTSAAAGFARFFGDHTANGLGEGEEFFVFKMFKFGEPEAASKRDLAVVEITGRDGVGGSGFEKIGCSSAGRNWPEGDDTGDETTWSSSLSPFRTSASPTFTASTAVFPSKFSTCLSFRPLEIDRPRCFFFPVSGRQSSSGDGGDLTTGFGGVEGGEEEARDCSSAGAGVRVADVPLDLDLPLDLGPTATEEISEADSDEEEPDADEEAATLSDAFFRAPLDLLLLLDLALGSDG